MVRIQEISLEEGINNDSMKSQFDAVAKKVSVTLMLNRQTCSPGQGDVSC